MQMICISGGKSKNRGGGPQRWMVLMENPIKMDDLGAPLFLETPISCVCFFVSFVGGNVY